MLLPPQYRPPTQLDQVVFAATVPEDHYLRLVKQAVDFQRCRDLMATTYCANEGRPALEPVLLLKLEFLQYQYNLSDRQVVEQAQYNMAFRWFLDLSLHSALPHHTSLTYFRERLGCARHQQIFDAVVGQAREKGLVKDRLRLKDATHVIANIAVPSTIRLVGQTCERLLEALRPWAGERVEAEQRKMAALATATADLPDPERLLQRVSYLRGLIAQVETLTHNQAFTAIAAPQQQALRDALQTAHQVLSDREDPNAKQRLRSLVDPDARHGRHGMWYDGYLVDASMDADSEIITAVNVLPAGANEGADVTQLLQQEEEAHGNDVQAVSLDGAGFQGPVLRTLTDPKGLHVEVFVPPSPVAKHKGFSSEQFTLDPTGVTMTCPAGQSTHRRHRSWRNHGWEYRFPRSVCDACPLRASCVPDFPRNTGRTVSTNDFEAEYRKARAKAQTPRFAEVRRQHRAIEHKLSEMVRWHHARRARYRGKGRVLVQQLLTAIVVNVKRIVKLLGMELPGDGTGGTVRAQWAG
jgi:transposase